MRVISGKARGIHLESLDGDATRPTLDRIKETLFNIIQTRIEDAYILDLFSGSAALAIESISRGAKFAILCDNSYKAIEVIRANIKKTHFESECKIIKNDYLKTLDMLKGNYKFDIIFIDPPYARNLGAKAVEKILENEILNEDGIIIFETDEEKRDLESLKNINVNVYDLRSYGRVKIIFLNRKG